LTPLIASWHTASAQLQSGSSANARLTATSTLRTENCICQKRNIENKHGHGKTHPPSKTNTQFKAKNLVRFDVFVEDVFLDQLREEASGLHTTNGNQTSNARSGKPA
jgi:hypothetical protein